MSRYPEKPAAPRGVASSRPRVLGDLSDSDVMEEARRRRERALAVGIPANSDADILVAPPILGATVAAQVLPPPSVGRRVYDGAMVVGAFLLGAVLFAPIAGYAALGSLPFEFGGTDATSDIAPTVPDLAIAGPDAPARVDDTGGGVPPIALASAGGTRPPQPPTLPNTATQDRAPMVAVAGSVFATALTAAPSLATAETTETLEPLRIAAASNVMRRELSSLRETEIEVRLPNVQAPSFDAAVFVHAPRSAQVAALTAQAILQTSGLTVSLTDPVNFGIRTSNVRYFHAEDRAAAVQVARLLGAELRDFTTFRPSPRIGTVEVWVAGRSTVPTLREVPVPTISTLPVPEALAPLPGAERRSGFLNRLLGGGHQPNRPAFEQDRDDEDDNQRNRFAATPAATNIEAAETAQGETDDHEPAASDGPGEDKGSQAPTSDDVDSPSASTENSSVSDTNDAGDDNGGTGDGA
ncbi:MAG: hypothetical protein AAFQ79_06415 [Pseudomonadota bacterium]